MASKDRHANTNLMLLQAIKEKPYNFGFFEAVRQLECQNADKPRLGKSLRPGDDPIRLGQSPTLKFSPSTLAYFHTEEDRKAPLLQGYFFGLFGPNGPLPLHLTEYARQRMRNARDPVLSEFADLFHHRLLSLFYRAWADKEPTVQFDRPDQDRFGFYLGTTLGLSTPGLLKRDAMPDLTKLHFAGHLGCHTKHAEGLGSMLSKYFRIAVKIREFVGEWLDMPEDSYCYLDDSDMTGQLGQSATIGTRSWQCQHRFQVQFGPMNLRQYEQMLPSGDRLKELRDIVRNYIGFEFYWDLNLLLEKEEVPTARLGEHVRLGWSSWLESVERENDSDDLKLQVELFSL